MGKKIKVAIDRSACCGYGICADICPQVYKLDQNQIVLEYTEIVPEALEGAAREGAAACPQNAIEVIEVD